MKCPVALASESAIYRREPLDSRPECIGKYVGVEVAQERDDIGGRSLGKAHLQS